MNIKILGNDWGLEREKKYDGSDLYKTQFHHKRQLAVSLFMKLEADYKITCSLNVLKGNPITTKLFIFLFASKQE